MTSDEGVGVGERVGVCVRVTVIVGLWEGVRVRVTVRIDLVTVVGAMCICGGAATAKPMTAMKLKIEESFIVEMTNKRSG